MGDVVLGKKIIDIRFFDGPRGVFTPIVLHKQQSPVGLLRVFQISTIQIDNERPTRRSSKWREGANFGAQTTNRRASSSRGHIDTQKLLVLDFDISPWFGPSITVPHVRIEQAEFGPSYGGFVVICEGRERSGLYPAGSAITGRNACKS